MGWGGQVAALYAVRVKCVVLNVRVGCGREGGSIASRTVVKPSGARLSIALNRAWGGERPLLQ